MNYKRFILYSFIGLIFSILQAEEQRFSSHSTELRAGANPTLFSNPGSLYEVVESINPQEGRLDTKADPFKFQSIFSTPWTVALQFNWCASSNHKTFLELSYTRAYGKKLIRQSQVRDQSGTEVPFTAEFKFDDFSLFGVYIGYRRYWNPCNKLFFHGGGKIGMGRYQDINMHAQRLEPLNPVLNVTGKAYAHDIVVSGGLQVGCDFILSKNLALVIQIEALGNGALNNTIDQFILNPNDSLVGGSNFIIGKTGTLVSFPVTIGLNWNW